MSVATLPVDIVLLGMIAAFLVLRLRSILGRQADGSRDPALRPQLRQLPESATPLPQPKLIAAQALPQGVCPPDVAATLDRLKARDPAFSAEALLGSAANIFKKLVEGFAAGERATLQAYLSPPLYQVFDAAIAQREAAHEKTHTEVREIRKMSLLSATVGRDKLQLTIEFVSDQVSYTEGPGNSIVHGSEALVEITDLWSFERSLPPATETWSVTDTRGA